MNLFLLRPAARRRRSLLVVAGLATAGLTLLPAATASAHVRVTPDNPTSGAFSALTFRVPNESETAGTVKLTVDLPKDTPFLYVSTKPVPGWTAVATTSKLAKPVESYGTTLTKAVSQVTWTADKGVAIGPGQYQEFSISVGPLPAAGTIALPTTQTYSDGEVVAWDQPTPESGEEPEHPAPELVVTAAAAGTDDHGGASADPSATPAAGDATTAASASSADPVARTLGGVGLVAGLVALVLAALVWRRGSGSVPRP